MGMTPVPADFDAFWQERMAEADAVDLDYEIMPSEIDPFDTVDYLDLWFTGMGGARIYAKYVKPRAETPIPLVLQFHGYPGSSRSWFEQSSFAGMGCALIAMDNPGQGGKSQDVGGFLGTTVSGHIIAGLDGALEDMYYVRLHQDVRILCRIVRELPGIDTSRIYVNGASQGGGMGLACCALNSDLIAKATILYPFLSDYRRVFELGADEIAYEGNIQHGWGNLSPQEMTRRFWEAACRGGYPGHGETYLDEGDNPALWWSHGGKLRGESWKRFRLLSDILKQTPGPGLAPYDRCGWDEVCAVPENEPFQPVKSYYLYYYSFMRPSFREFHFDDTTPFEVRVIDTWEMTVEDRGVFSGRFRVELPGKEYMAIQIRRAD